MLRSCQADKIRECHIIGSLGRLAVARGRNRRPLSGVSGKNWNGRNWGAKPPSAKRLGPLQKSDHKSGRESLLCFFTSLPHFRDELAFGVIRRAGRWQQARQLAGGHGARSSYCATCLLCVRTSQPFHQRSKAGCDDESSASHFDDLDLAFADKHIERAAPDPKIATGVRDTHDDRFDSRAPTLLSKMLCRACSWHTGRSFRLSGDDGPTWGAGEGADQPAIDTEYRSNTPFSAT